MDGGGGLLGSWQLFGRFVLFPCPPHPGSLAAVLRPPIDELTPLAVFPRNPMPCSPDDLL